MRSSSSNSLSPNHPEQYIRARDDPFFDGMRRGDAAAKNRTTMFDFQGKVTGRTISRSASDIGDNGFRNILIDRNISSSPLKDSPSDIIIEPFGHSSSGRWSIISNTTSYPLASVQSNLGTDFEEEGVSLEMSTLRVSEEKEECNTLTVLSRPAIQKSYSLNNRTTNLHKIPLPPSAASFYNGYSPQIEIVELCDGTHKLNLFLKNRRDEVKSGVPGKFLHAVMGQNVSDVGSVASTIMYAFYLNETLRSNQLCTVPVINMKRTDLNFHSELIWLFDLCRIDQSSLFFVDEDLRMQKTLCRA